jgi:hypothetical protein
MPDAEKGAPILSETTALLQKPLSLVGKLDKDPPIIAYDPEQLTNWRAIITLQGTIFLQPAVVFIIVTQIAVALSICLALVLFSKHPEHYKSDAMEGIVKTVAVSIAFLLGMFLSSCVSRWWDTIKSLEMLFGTIKRLTMTAINVELPHDVRVTLARRCVLSTRLLQVELTESHLTLSGKQTREELDEHWHETFAHWRATNCATDEEIHTLRKVPQQQRSFFAWSLVSKELLTHRSILVNQDGNLDVMAYDRLCELVQDGVSSVSSVRTAAAFQMPYIYVHLLAFMIHFVNALTALGTGVQMGLLIATANKTNTSIDGNQLASVMTFLVVQAFIYQAFLTIGAALSFPITGSAYRIPLKAMVEALDHQLRLMNVLADQYTAREEDADEAIDAEMAKMANDEDAEDLGF